MERRLAAVLAADVVSYSALMAHDQPGTLAALRQLRNEQFGPAVSRFRGNLIKSMGDGWLVEFPSVSDAVNCALDVQRGLLGYDLIRLRIGIHIGEVAFEDEDIFGDGVNIAARLEALASPGEVLISDTAHRSLDVKSAGQFAGGDVRALKNIARPIGVWYWPANRRVEGKAATQQPPHSTLDAPRLSIVVLPIVNSSGDTSQDYFAAALGDDLTSDLSRISGSFVVARSTAATYRGTKVNPMVVARELKVRYVLEGNLRASKPVCRVSMWLTDGQTGQQIWSEQYERSASEMYSFQNEVTGRIARSLNLQLKEAVSRQAERGTNVSMEAADLAIRAWAELWTKPQSHTTNDAALDLANRSLDIDPKNGEANACLAYACARAALYGWGMTRGSAIKRGIDAAEISLESDPKNADAAYALALLNYAAGENFFAREFLEQCLDLNRNHAPAYFLSGLTCIRLGWPQDAISYLDQAFRLSPRDPMRAVWHGAKARAHLLLGDHQSAIREAQRGIAANRDHAHNYAALAAALAALNRIEEGKKAGQELERRLPGITVDRYMSEVTSDDPTAKASYEPLREGLLKVGLPR